MPLLESLPTITRGIDNLAPHLDEREDLQVPFVDLSPSNDAVKRRVLERIEELIDRGDFVNGAAVEEFEARFADVCGVRHCVGVGSGLDALRLALLAAGAGEGSEVVVPAATFAASFEAVLQADARPVVVDISAADYGLDVDLVERALGSSVTHVMPVHLYGQLSDMKRLLALAERSGIAVVEDACQAHGAARDGIRPGAGLAAAFSFYPAKNLGAFGDAGAVATDDADVAELVRSLRQHGESSKYHHDLVGYTARLDTLQAIVLFEKLEWLDEWNRRRREAALHYLHLLADLDTIELPRVPDGSDPVWHLLVVQTSDPEALASHLAEHGIRTGRHYPQPPHLAPAYRSLGYAPGDFPVAEALARRGLSLPLFPGITGEQIEHVCARVRAYFEPERRRPA